MRKEAQKAGDAERMQIWAGQSAKLVQDQPAGIVCQRLWEDALRLCDELISWGSIREDMPNVGDQTLLDALLDSWDRNNAILVNLLRALPEGGLETRAIEGSPSVAEMFTHIHYVRLVFVSEDAPDFATSLPDKEWAVENDRSRIARMLNDSSKTVRDAVKSRIETRREMELHYDHPILLLEHMIWHEGYHHGQIKLALKIAGRPASDDDVGHVTWGVWMKKKLS